MRFVRRQGDTAFSDTLMIAEGAEGAEGDGGTEGEGVVVDVVVTNEALRHQSAMHMRVEDLSGTDRPSQLLLPLRKLVTSSSMSLTSAQTGS